MTDFNATQVALERMASFFNDLPLGIDERQLAGKDQKKVETLSYMLSNGMGRARGNRTGGLQALYTWHTVIISTGEEPISTDTTQTGVSTRTFEIYGGSFENEKSASRMHQHVSSHYGWAGEEFIKNLIQTDEETILEQYEKMSEEIYSITTDETSGAHIAVICTVALADAMADTWIFRNETGKNQHETDQTNKKSKKPLEIRNESLERAIQMAKDMLHELLMSKTSDVNVNATQFAVDWILSNRNQFEKNQSGGQVYGMCYGFIKNDKAYIFPSVFKKALSDAGYNPNKTIRYLAENNIITSKEQKGGKSNTVSKYFIDRNQRFIEFNLGKFLEKNTDDEEQENAWHKLESNEQVPFYEQQKLP